MSWLRHLKSTKTGEDISVCVHQALNQQAGNFSEIAIEQSVELLLLEDTEIDDCVVLSRETKMSGRELVAYVVSSRPFSPQRLQSHLQAVLPAGMPIAYVPVSTLPLTPVCILYSDPTFPDRSQAIINGLEETLVNILIKTLGDIFEFGVSKIVITCITIQYFLPRLPEKIRKKIISLTDLIIQEVLATKKRCLLLCTNGTRQARTFQRHELWGLTENYLVLPNNDEQSIVHELIYKIKKW